MSPAARPAVTERPAAFLRALFDLSFRQLVTPRLIRVLYLLWLLITALTLLLIAITIFAASGDQAGNVNFDRGGGFFVEEDEGGGNVLGGLAFLLLGCPVLFLLSAVIGRVQLEFVMALFQVAENTSAMREHLAGGPPAGARTAADPARPDGGDGSLFGGPAPDGPAPGGSAPGGPAPGGPTPGGSAGGPGPGGPPAG